MLRLPKNRKKVFGMNSILNTSILLPVKTGTSTDFRDNWTVSYSPTHIIGVWVGNTDQTPMKDVSGISGAGGIWHKIVEYMIAEKYIQDTPYTPPQGIIHASLCSDIHCYQKESIYTKDISHGHILHNKAPFPRSRFFGDITEEEMQTWDIIQDT